MELKALANWYHKHLNKKGHLHSMELTYKRVKFHFPNSEKNIIVHKSPQMNGISGSGLWFLKDFAKPEMVVNKQLIGLIIERVNKLNNQVLIATRIDLVTEFIRQHFNLSIPKSKTTTKVKVNRE